MAIALFAFCTDTDAKTINSLLRVLTYATPVSYVCAILYTELVSIWFHICSAYCETVEKFNFGCLF